MVLRHPLLRRPVQWFRIGVGLVLAAWALGVLLAAAGESFPAEHREPITVRVLDGKTGKPLAHLRLTLVGGYTEKDIGQRLWREEAVTDAAGEVRVPRALGDLPFLEVRPRKTKLCQETSRGETYNVGRIRGEGFNAPNSCGFVKAAASPQVLVVFARSHEDAEDAPQGPAQGSLDVPVRVDAELAAPCAWGGNEIDSLLRPRRPVQVLDDGGDGTVDSPDAYDVLCQPEE